MQVKKFEAPTMNEALENVKRELGPEAIILQTKNNRKGFGLLSNSSVEVTAAVSERSAENKQTVRQKLPEENREQIEQLPASKQAEILRNYEKKQRGSKKRTAQSVSQKVNKGEHPHRAQKSQSKYIDIADSHESSPQPSQNIGASHRAKKFSESNQAFAYAQQNDSPKEEGQKQELKQEVEELKKMIHQLKENQQNQSSVASTGPEESVFSSEALEKAFEQLVINGVERRYALSLIKKVSFQLSDQQQKSDEVVMDHLAYEIMQSTEKMSLLDGLEEKKYEPSMIALIGPTGVGKTTTAAKLASEAVFKKHLKVGLINIDCYRIGAADQLETYAQILNAPFRSVTNTSELAAAIQDFQTMDLILLDTTGRSQRDVESLNEMKELIDQFPKIRTELVLSATTRDAEMQETGKRFGVFRPEGVVFSKLDETMVFGSIYNTFQKLKLPLLYFTTGQRVPEDIEEATPERLVTLLMEV